MKDREFNKVLKSVCLTEGKGKNKTQILCAEKISVLDSEIKNEVINYLVRKRAPIVMNFVNNTTDMKWLASMGYMYHKQGKKFAFLCTCENQNQIS